MPVGISSFAAIRASPHLRKWRQRVRGHEPTTLRSGRSLLQQEIAPRRPHPAANRANAISEPQAEISIPGGGPVQEKPQQFSIARSSRRGAAGNTLHAGEVDSPGRFPCACDNRVTHRRPMRCLNRARGRDIGRPETRSTCCVQQPPRYVATHTIPAWMRGMRQFRSWQRGWSCGPATWNLSSETAGNPGNRKIKPKSAEDHVSSDRVGEKLIRHHLPKSGMGYAIRL